VNLRRPLLGFKSIVQRFKRRRPVNPNIYAPAIEGWFCMLAHICRESGICSPPFTLFGNGCSGKGAHLIGRKSAQGLRVDYDYACWLRQRV